MQHNKAQRTDNPSPLQQELLDALTSQDTMLIHVKQPWAWALVTGEKDVENRTFKLKPTSGFPVWVPIVASKSVPTNKDGEEMARRIYLQAGPDASVRSVKGKIPAKHEFVLDKIVGMVDVIGCYSEKEMPFESVWYNALDFGWVVGKAVKFSNSIDVDSTDHFQTMVKLSNRPQYLPRLREEIMKI